MADSQSRLKSRSTLSLDLNLTPGPVFRLCLASTIIMLLWPWIFFGVTWGLGGIKMHHTAASIVHEHPQDAAYFVTALCSGISAFIAFLFSAAIVNLSQQWVVHKDTTVLHITLFSALKNVTPPVLLLREGKVALFVIAVVYYLLFLLITPGITALLTPVPFNQTISLTGTELDFASTDTGCIDWFNNNTIPHRCDWMTYNGLSYTDCLEENQMVDVLESGRGSILSLISNNDVSLTFTQLGGVGGLHFLGSMRGVLPIGPDGVPAFDTLPPSTFSDTTALRGLSYSYTLELQGVLSNISCAYDTRSPIAYSVPLPGMWQYNGTRPPGQDILTGAAFLVPPSNNSMGFWACQTGQSGNSFTVYFRGIVNYAAGIGNITCNISPMQPAVFSLAYSATPGIFNFTTQKPILTSPNTSTELVRRTVMGLGSNVWEAQNMAANLVAESVITFGVKSFGLQPYVRNDTYLRLYEAMIRGILDYQATYIRLIYSTKVSGVNPAPSSCIRLATGSADVEVFGWFVTRKTAAYLIAITLVNLTTLGLLFASIRITDEEGNRRRAYIDPTDPATFATLMQNTGQTIHSVMRRRDSVA